MSWDQNPRHSNIVGYDGNPLRRSVHISDPNRDIQTQSEDSFPPTLKNLRLNVGILNSLATLFLAALFFLFFWFLDRTDVLRDSNIETHSRFTERVSKNEAQIEALQKEMDRLSVREVSERAPKSEP